MEDFEGSIPSTGSAEFSEALIDHQPSRPVVMAETKRKGDLGEAMIMADVLRRGYQVAIPVGEDWRYDLIVLRHAKLERVQCKFTSSDGHAIQVKCRSTNNWVMHKYTAKDLDWLAVYDKTTDRCYFVPASLLGEGRTVIHLRLTQAKNGQQKGLLWAKDFVDW